MANFFDKISQNFESFTHSQKKVANYVMDNHNNIAFNTLEEVAEKIGVSTTTVIRFTRELGYSGYSDMQKDIQSTIMNKVSLPERLTEVIEIPKNQLLKDSFSNDIQNIQDTLAMLSEETLEDAVSSISAARKIYILGMRSSFSLAYYLTSRLGQIKNNVSLIQSAGMMYPEEIVSAEPGDVCIAYLFPRYSKTTAKILSWLKKNGVKIVLFTSLNESSVHGYGDIILPCAVSGISFKNSYTAPLCLTNYIFSALATSDYEGSKKTLERTEEILSQGFYLGL